LLQKDRMMT